MQIWLGFFLIVSGISFGRMGPSFKRNQYTLPFIILGTLCMFLPNSNTGEPELALLNVIYDFLPWFTTSFLGYCLVLMGAPTYWKARVPQLISGWIIILVSIYLYFEYNSHLSPKSVIIISSSLLGILISLIFFAFLVRYVENSTPLEDETPELTDKEKEFVRDIISKNIGVGNE